MEEFFRDYQYTFSALGAAGTLLAVIVSLFFGLKSFNNTKIQLKATLGIRLLIGIEQRYVTINIVNTGLIPLKIEVFFFSFYFPFKNVGWICKPLDFGNSLDSNIPTKNYPIVINPKDSCVFFLNHADKLFFKGMNKFLVNFVRARVHSSDGSKFRVEVNKDIKNLIKDNIKKEVTQ